MTGRFFGLVCLSLLLLPARGYADFIVTNMLTEVGVSAGDNSDGVGGHDISEAFLSISDGVKGTPDYQFAEASFGLIVEDDNALGDYVLTYDSQTFALTGGIGNANALANGIIVFSLTEEFEVISHLGETVLSLMGEPFVIQQDSPVLLSEGIYSLSFGSSAAVFGAGSDFEDSDSVSGVVSFNATTVPEPGAASILALLIGIFARRSRN